MYQQARKKSFAPVSEGEEIDVKIEAVGEKGDGIAKRKGFVLFVPGANEGDEIRVRVTKVLQKVGFAEKIGAAKGPVEKPIVPPPVREPEPVPEDSEDFGEEPSHGHSGDQDDSYDDSEEEFSDEDEDYEDFDEEKN